MAYPISEENREELRAAMPKILESELGITDLHRHFRCPDPNHEDSSPSAIYYPDSHTVHCFGCNQTWNVFSLVGMLHDIRGFVDQARCVARIIHYDLGPSPASGAGASAIMRNWKKPAFPLHKAASMCIDRSVCFDMYMALFAPEGNIARNYLHARGIDDSCIARHCVGFAKSPSRVIPEFHTFEPEARGFVMIPFCEKGNASANYCIARPVGTRSPTHKEWRPKGAVSTLWQEWLLYEHSPVLYVTEGVLDAMSLEQEISKPCIALCGTGSISRLSSILYYMPSCQRPEKIMIAMDEDDAGHEAGASLADALGAMGVPYSLMPPYPDGAKDANEWHVAERGKAWDYETKLWADDRTPLHIMRRIDNGR